MCDYYLHCGLFSSDTAGMHIIMVIETNRIEGLWRCNTLGAKCTKFSWEFETVLPKIL